MKRIRAFIFILFTFSFSLFTFYSFSQGIGINTTGNSADVSAMLDIGNGTNDALGLLIPRVHLLSTADAITIASPAPSLMVYNTNGSITGGLGVGYYYNSGTTTSANWVRLISGNGTMILGTGTSSRVAFWSNDSALSSSANLYWDNINSRLGIGTTSPVSLLNAEGNGSANELFRISNDKNSTKDSTLVFSSAGSVGIGTTSPSAKLTVRGTDIPSEPVSIAYGNAVANGYNSVSGTYTISGTVNSGSNLVLIAAVHIYNTSAPSGVTWNGVALTLIASTAYGGSSDWFGVYYLINPNIGTHNLVISTSSRSSIVAVTYTGVKQTGFPDAFYSGNSLMSSSSLSHSLNSIADNCFFVLAYEDDQDEFLSASNWTMKSHNNANGNIALGDNGSAVTPAGSLTQTINYNIQGERGYVQFSMEPASVTPPQPPLANFVNSASSTVMSVSDDGNVGIGNLAGTGTRPVVADANGVLSATAGGAPITFGTGNPPTSNSTQTITHGLGKTPTYIKIKGLSSGTSDVGVTISEGVYNGSNFCIYSKAASSVGTSSISTSYSIYMETYQSGVKMATGVIGNVGATTFDIVWTSALTNANGGVYLWEAQ